ncbi:MAG: hypothetical protein Q9157_003100 [Trypethelium eluteriae]
MLTAILTHHQVIPRFLEFLIAFGKRERATEAKFGGFCCEMTLDDRPKHAHLLETGHFNQGFQLCYSLSSPEPSQRDARRPWSIRQTAVYHAFNIQTGRTTWIIVKGNDLIKTRITEQTSLLDPELSEALEAPYATFAASLLSHLLICDWSNEEWRWYTTYLESEMENMTSHTKTVDPESYQYTFAELQRSEHLFEKADEALTICTTNISVLGELNSFYTDHIGSASSEEPAIRECKHELGQFSRRVLSMVQDLYLQVARLQSLLRLLSGRKALLLSCLEYRNAQANTRLSQEAHFSAMRMERLTQQMNIVARRTEEETVTMRIITLVATFFLPGTFISASVNFSPEYGPC